MNASIATLRKIENEHVSMFIPSIHESNFITSDEHLKTENNKKFEETLHEN